MVKYYDDCVSCADGCHGCGRNRETAHLICDCCGDEAETLYKYNGDEFCLECLAGQFDSYSYEDFDD